MIAVGEQSWFADGIVLGRQQGEQHIQIHSAHIAKRQKRFAEQGGADDSSHLESQYFPTNERMKLCKGSEKQH